MALIQDDTSDLEKDAGQAKAHFDQGNALLSKGQLVEAAVAYGKAIELSAEHFNALMNLGGVLSMMGDRDGAIEYLKRAAAVDTGSTTVRTNLALIYTEYGELDLAEECVDAALAIDPDDVLALCHLARLKGGHTPEQAIARMDRLLREGIDLSDKDRQHLHAGLVRCRDGRKEYASSAEHMKAANALAKAELEAKGMGYDLTGFDRLVARSIELYTPQFLQAASKKGIDSDRPVFVVGLPRSGTTLMATILGNHPAVFNAGERRTLPAYFQALPKLTRLDRLPIDCVSCLGAKEIRGIAEGYLSGMPAEALAATRVVDKEPSNCMILGLAMTLFPRGKIIYIRRDLRDVALSCWMIQFGGQRWACDEQWLAGYLHGNLRMMEHWVSIAPEAIVQVDYEQLVSDPEPQVRRLTDWLGLPWDPACLDIRENKARIGSASVVQARQSIHTRSVGRWEHYLPYFGDLFEAVST